MRLKETTSSPKTHGPPSAQGLEFLAWLMDRAFRIPGTKIQLGLDALLGLLPLGGDFLTGLIQVGIVLVAITRYKVPKVVAVRMASNVLLDLALGTVPVLGDLFDVAFKANTRNLQLLRDYEQERTRAGKTVERSSLRFVLLLAAIFAVTLALVLVGFVTVVAWLLGHPLF